MRNKGKKNLWMDYPQKKKKITMKYKVFLVIKKICLRKLQLVEADLQIHYKNIQEHKKERVILERIERY